MFLYITICRFPCVALSSLYTSVFFLTYILPLRTHMFFPPSNVCACSLSIIYYSGSVDDLWMYGQWGVTLYCFLFGERPFQSVHMRELYAEIRTVEPYCLQQQIGKKDLPTAVKHVFDCSWYIDIDLKDRYLTCIIDITTSIIVTITAATSTITATTNATTMFSIITTRLLCLRLQLQVL